MKTKNDCIRKRTKHEETEGIWMANKYREKIVTSFATGEMQIESRMTCPFTPIGAAKIRNT